MANNIRMLRKKRGLTMKKLGQEFGLAESTISQYENGHREPDNETLLKLAKFFGVSVGYLLGAEDQDATHIANILPLPKSKNFPLIGSIACGQPILATENLQGHVSYPDDIDADFCLRCQGDSMINARIFDGDIVFIRQQPEVENGEIAAVRIGDEATLKKVYYTPGSDRITLRACNPLYPDMEYSGEELNQIEILGKAVCFLSHIK